MDFIYAKFDNNLVDINRIDKIVLLQCEKDKEPLLTLSVGDYYLKITIVDSNKISYCDLSALTKDNNTLNEKLLEEINRAKEAENKLSATIEEKENNLVLKINNLDITLKAEIKKVNDSLLDEISTRQEEGIEIKNSITSLDKSLSDRIQTETSSREEADKTLTENLEQEINSRINENATIKQEQTNIKQEQENILSEQQALKRNIDNINKIIDPNDENTIAKLLFEEI